MSLSSKMSQKHEGFVAEELGGRKTKASGSQFNDQTDGRGDRYSEHISLAWDCKATHAKSMGISREMLHKLVQQAGGDVPILPIRFYEDTRLRNYEDWVIIRFATLVEMKEMAEYGYRVKEIVKMVLDGRVNDVHRDLSYSDDLDLLAKVVRDA
jgi:hypothetical protein